MPPPASDPAVLDDPVGGSLRGHHAQLAVRRGSAVTFRADVATFSAVPPAPDPGDWADLATLLGPGGFADLFSLPAYPPADWEPLFSMPGLQLVGPAERFPQDGDDVVELGPDDVPEMLELAALTRPGPFWRRTHELGRFIGIRRDGRLVAMAGERLRPPGWTEISSVCTAPEFRGRGLAAQLVRSLASSLVARGDQPFLHVATENVGALALYERLGFEVRREVTFHGYRTPAQRG